MIRADLEVLKDWMHEAVSLLTFIVWKKKLHGQAVQKIRFDFTIPVQVYIWQFYHVDLNYTDVFYRPTMWHPLY